MGRCGHAAYDLAHHLALLRKVKAAEAACRGGAIPPDNGPATKKAHHRNRGMGFQMRPTEAGARPSDAG